MTKKGKLNERKQQKEFLRREFIFPSFVYVFEYLILIGSSTEKKQPMCIYIYVYIFFRFLHYYKISISINYKMLEKTLFSSFHFFFTFSTVAKICNPVLESKNGMENYGKILVGLEFCDNLSKLRSHHKFNEALIFQFTPGQHFRTFSQ
jgi:hypothetical protein